MSCACMLKKAMLETDETYAELLWLRNLAKKQLCSSDIENHKAVFGEKFQHAHATKANLE